jgi:hypothetical protein
VWVTPPVQEPKAVDLGDAEARARMVWALARWRAAPVVSLCRPAPGAPAAEGREAQPDAGQVFLAELAAAGVSILSENGPTCQRGDQNMARLSLG